MARPRLDIGTFGGIWFDTEVSGRVTARTRYRDWDGRRRLVHEVATSWYQALPLSKAAHLLGRSVESVKGATFDAWARSEEPTSVDGYYAMTVDLAELAGPQATLTLLDDALEQFDAVVLATSVDLPPVDVPAKANSVAHAVARLVWGALAEPATATRWDAAFAVLGLLRLDQDDVLVELGRLAEAGESGFSGDPAFEFYALHADWFLLLALRRAVVDSELLERVRRFGPFLKRVIAAPPHAILSPLALEVTAALDGRNLPTWPPVEPVRVGWSHRGQGPLQPARGRLPVRLGLSREPDPRCRRCLRLGSRAGRARRERLHHSSLEAGGTRFAG